MTQPAPEQSFWRRRVLEPILALLKQGLTTHEIALTIALGVAGGIFPFLGFTAGLCFLLALAFRLNQPIIQLINQLLWPVQLTMIVVYIKIGSWIYGVQAMPFDPTEVTRIFAESPNPWNTFWSRFGLMGLHALTAWLISLPVVVPAIYFSTRPILIRLAARRNSKS